MKNAILKFRNVEQLDLKFIALTWMFALGAGSLYFFWPNPYYEISLSYAVVVACFICTLFANLIINRIDEILWTPIIAGFLMGGIAGALALGADTEVRSLVIVSTVLTIIISSFTMYGRQVLHWFTSSDDPLKSLRDFMFFAVFAFVIFTQLIWPLTATFNDVTRFL